MRQWEISTGHRLPSSTRVTTDLALSILAGEVKREMCLDMRLNHVLNTIVEQAFVVRKVFLQCPDSSWMGQLIFSPTPGGLNTAVRTKATIRLARKTSTVLLLISSI